MLRSRLLSNTVDSQFKTTAWLLLLTKWITLHLCNTPPKTHVGLYLILLLFRANKRNLLDICLMSHVWINREFDPIFATDVSTVGPPPIRPQAGRCWQQIDVTWWGTHCFWCMWVGTMWYLILLVLNRVQLKISDPFDIHYVLSLSDYAVS